MSALDSRAIVTETPKLSEPLNQSEASVLQSFSVSKHFKQLSMATPAGQMWPQHLHLYVQSFISVYINNIIVLS